MDNEMIERCAKALYEQASLAYAANNKHWDDIGNIKEMWRASVVTVIKAMRELSPNLIDAGDIQIEFDGSFELAWHKTIDAIVGGE